jgi:hypothetical protein
MSIFTRSVAVAAVLAALACAAAGQAAGATGGTQPAYWSVAKATYGVSQAELMQLQGDSYYGPVSHYERSQTCRGTGVHRANRYRTFACTVGLPIHGTSPFTAWARLTAKGLCVTTVAPAVCTTPLMSHDPRICAYPSYPPVFGPLTRADGCVHRQAESAFERRVGILQWDLCRPTGLFRFLCFSGRVGTWSVAWANRAWSVTPA